MMKSAMSKIASGISSLKTAEHTGANRCPPCTVVNLGIATLLGVGLGVEAPAIGAAAFGLSLAVIYLRGYLVPGTPRLTKRFLPDTILKRFEHRKPVLTDGGSGGNPLEETIEKLEYQREHSVDAEQFLHDVGAVETAADGEERLLTPSFRHSVEEAAESYKGVIDVEYIGDMFDATPDEISVPDRDYPAIKVRRMIRRWPSEAAFMADAASHEVLSETSEEWASVPLEQRVDMLKSIRSLWETCPMCGADVAFDEETVTSCCREFEVVTRRCQSCEAHFVEHDPNDVSSDVRAKGFIP